MWLDILLPVLPLVLGDVCFSNFHGVCQCDFAAATITTAVFVVGFPCFCAHGLLELGSVVVLVLVSGALPYLDKALPGMCDRQIDG